MNIAKVVSNLTKEGVWVIAGQLASFMGALFLVRVLTEYLDPAGYGLIVLALTIVNFIHQVFIGGVSSGIVRYYSIAREKEKIKQYYHAAKWLLSLLSIFIVLVILGVVTGLIIFEKNDYAVMLFLAGLIACAAGFNSSISGVMSAARKRKIAAIFMAMDSWLKILIVALALFFFQSSTSLILGSYLVSCVINFFLQVSILSKLVDKSKFLDEQEQQRHTYKYWKEQIIKYALPFSLWGPFVWALQASDKWALQLFSSVDDVGLYGVAFQVGYVPTSMVSSFMLLYLGPIFYQKSGDAKSLKRNLEVHSIAWKITMLSLFCTFLVFITCIFFHRELFGILVNDRYLSVSYILPWMILAGGIFSSAQALALKLLSELKSSSMILANVVPAILGVCMNCYGAYRFGIDGVVCSLIIFSVIYFFWLSWLSKSVTNHKK